MPAPAVIPALIAYVKVVAVKTLVVGFRSSEARLGALGLCSREGVRLGFGSGGRRSIVPSGVLRFAAAYRAFGVARLPSRGVGSRWSGPGYHLP